MNLGILMDWIGVRPKENRLSEDLPKKKFEREKNIPGIFPLNLNKEKP